jgi:cell division transport system permease protein
MRRLLVIFVALLATGVSGCGLLTDEDKRNEDKRIEDLLNQKAIFTVFLRDDATQRQRDDLRTGLEAIPDVTGVEYEDHQTAYDRMTALYSADPTAMPRIDPSHLPESFIVTMPNLEAVRKFRDSALNAQISALPGVDRLVIYCATVAECKERMAATTPD